MSKGIKLNHSFLEPGHTHMEADTIHALIEKYKKSTSAIIEVPRDWSTTIRAIHRKNKLHVTEIQQMISKALKVCTCVLALW